MPPDAASVHENDPFHWTVVWAAQLLLTANVWFDDPPAAGSDGADPVGGSEVADPVDGAEGADQVVGTEGAGDSAGLVSGPEDAGPVAGPDDFAWCPWLGAALGDDVFDFFIAGGIDAVAIVIGASDGGVSPDWPTAATCWAEPVKPACVLLPVGVAAQAVAARTAEKTAAAPGPAAILRLPPVPAAWFPTRSPGTVGVLMGLLEWPGRSQGYRHNRTYSAVFISLNGSR